MERKIKEHNKRKDKYSEIIGWFLKGMSVPDVMLLCQYHGFNVSKNTLYRIRREYINGEARYDENNKRII